MIKKNNLPLFDYNLRKLLRHESCPRILVTEAGRTGIIVQRKATEKEEAKYPGIPV